MGSTAARQFNQSITGRIKEHSMTFTTLLSLSFALLIIAATPGPGVIMTLTRSLQDGFRAGTWVTAGIVFMDLLVLIATLSGLSLLAHFSQPGLMIIKWLGVLFLIWMAWQSWRRQPLTQPLLNPQPHRDFFGGIAVSLSNPILFYLAFLPAFIDLNNLTPFDAILLIILITFIVTFVLLAYALAASRLQIFLFKKHGLNQRWLNRSSAGVLLFLAAILLYSNL